MSTEKSLKKRVSQTPCVKEGFLYKRGGNVKSWKYRYFRQLGCHLRYYSNNESEEPLGNIYLPGATIQMIPADSYAGHDYCFILCPLDTTRRYVIEAETAKLRADWIDSLRPAINMAVRRMDVNSIREGHIFKLSFKTISVLQHWSQRYCVVTPGSLKLYKHLQDISNKPVTHLDLSWSPTLTVGLPSTDDMKTMKTSVSSTSSPSASPRSPRSPSTTTPLTDHPSCPFTLSLTPPSSSSPRTSATHYIFDCHSDTERTEWMTAIKKGFVKPPKTTPRK